MIHRRNMTMIDADLPGDELVRQVLESQHTRIPLWRGEPDNIVGVLHAKGLLRALRNNEWKPDGLLAEGPRVGLQPEATAFSLLLDGQPSEEELRGAQVTERVSLVARMPEVREWVNGRVREAAAE
jgi:CBS domain containing-hemolysin-like protein